MWLSDHSVSVLKGRWKLSTSKHFDGLPLTLFDVVPGSGSRTL